MVKVIIATHGYLSQGLKQSLEFIMGKQKNLFAVAAYTEECPNPTTDLRKICEDKDEEIIFLTDIYGGSVNTEITTLLPEYPNARLYCGVNLPFLISLFNSLMINDKEIESALSKALKAGQEGMFDSGKKGQNSDKNTEFDDF